jgi:formylglycine-generating enzyme required for sulfatase activity
MKLKQLIFVVCVIPLFWQSAQAENEKKSFANIRFVRIEAGCFTMGRETELKGSSDVETPAHKVCIEKPFYLGETEVTQKQWQTVMGDNPSKYKGEYKPVEKVSWEDVQKFIVKLNEQEGGKYFRLPTEAEWEYSARAGSSTLYSFGDKPNDLGTYAWFGNEGYHGTSEEVGTKKPNQWGLFDMHGNVWEWVQDWYDPNYYHNSPEKDPKGAESGQYKVYRGGSWVGKAINLRSAVRYSGLPVSRTNDIGFRLLREIQ